MGMALGPKDRRAKLKRPRGVGFMGRGCSPPHQLGVRGSTVSSSNGVLGEAPVTWRFRYTKPLPQSILLILNLLQ